MTETYPPLRRVERDGVIACALMAAAAWALARGAIGAPLGVLGGGALAWISYRGIKGGVIMARLRLPPLAVFAGASSLVVAVAVEAVRGTQWKS
jgi:hypothetical protein